MLKGVLSTVAAAAALVYDIVICMDQEVSAIEPIIAST